MGIIKELRTYHVWDLDVFHAQFLHPVTNKTLRSWWCKKKLSSEWNKFLPKYCNLIIFKSFWPPFLLLQVYTKTAYIDIKHWLFPLMGFIETFAELFICSFSFSLDVSTITYFVFLTFRIMKILRIKNQWSGVYVVFKHGMTVTTGTFLIIKTRTKTCSK